MYNNEKTKNKNKKKNVNWKKEYTHILYIWMHNVYVYALCNGQSFKMETIKTFDF